MITGAACACVEWTEAHRVRRITTELGAVIETRLNSDLVKELGLCPVCYKVGVSLPPAPQ